MNEKVKIEPFKSNEEFYVYVDCLRIELNEKGFSKTSQELNFILHETAYTTSSEFFGEIKFALLSLKENAGKKLSTELLENVNMCLTTIENAFDRANSKS